ncbi:MAG TPA: SMP-30/gluconolactonase/LRE family protein [Chryseolinea sp.]|nr:SMP-30/gluconolactonase/LRE family protein [Flavobacteriales bacterium]HPH46570.1 SMP-30/gluconolactonase/LRE family protein [Chryseolinea sp.]HPM32160.1 SMP-30/gluconolactonase/LRE family protein [Chryseolinea sp.]
MKTLFYILAIVTLISCAQKEMKTIGTIERIDPALDAIIQGEPKVEVIAEGFKWSEGPIWIKEQNLLLFSDVPTNTIYKWTAEKGKEVYLTPSGYTGTSTHYSNEPGSNGITLNSDGKLVLCQHGDRRVALMDAPLTAPEAKFITLVDNYQGKKLNSPNDAVFRSNGDLFLTDPPYGLMKQENDSTREIPFQGVFKVSNGVASLITDSLTRPNGIAFLPGEKTLIVANSDPGKATWYAFDLLENDSVANARIFYDATENTKTEKGLPDGLKIDKQGNVFASGPGGIWIFNKDGKVLGKIKISEPTSNCALADDDKTLYATSNMYVVRIKLRD